LHTPHLTAIFSVVMCNMFSLIVCLRCFGDISDILTILRGYCCTGTGVNLAR
jgi:hypothetical protein